jgi:hypothetical protein
MGAMVLTAAIAGWLLAITSTITIKISQYFFIVFSFIEWFFWRTFYFMTILDAVKIYNKSLEIDTSLMPAIRYALKG